jgi:hypothetical protein
MCRVMFDDGDRLYGSTLPYTILDVDVLVLRIDVICLVDSHRYKSSGRSHSHVGPSFHELEAILIMMSRGYV